jgi:hypothetical protein
LTNDARNSKNLFYGLLPGIHKNQLASTHLSKDHSLQYQYDFENSLEFDSSKVFVHKQATPPPLPSLSTVKHESKLNIYFNSSILLAFVKVSYKIIISGL